MVINHLLLKFGGSNNLPSQELYIESYAGNINDKFLDLDDS